MWLFQGLAGIAFAAVIPLALWMVSLEVRLQTLEADKARQDAKMAKIETEVKQFGAVQQDIAVIKVEIGHVKDGQTDLKALIQAERGQ